MFINKPKKAAFGVDVSDLSLKIVQFKKNKKDLKASFFLKQNIPKSIIEGGVIKKPEELSQEINQMIKKARKKSLQGDRAICNLPEEKVFIKIIQLPKMKQEEIDKAIKWEAEAYIPINIEDVYLSWQVIDSDNKEADHLDVLVAAAPKYLVDSYVDVFYKANLKLTALEPESVAVTRSLLNPNNSNSYIIVDLGVTASNFVIFSDGAIRFTSQISVSGDRLDQAIETKLGVSKKEARKLKIKLGLGSEDSAYKIGFDEVKKIKKQKHSASKAMIPILEELAEQIKDYISFYRNNKAHFSSNRIDKILLCGGDSLLKGLPEFLEKRIGCPVKKGNPLVNIIKDNGIKIDKPILYATAIGLSLREFM